MAYQETAEGHHEHHHVNYQWIFYLLCGCTALSWLADESYGWGVIDSKKVIAILVLAIAVAKAQFVMRYFMHLKFEGAWKYVLLLPTAILACGLPLALAPDIGLHYYRPDVPQVREAERLELAGGAAHGSETEHEPEEAEHHNGEAH